MSLPVPSDQTHLTHPKYRADIDGLRAIAVFSVVGFHAFPNWVRGGFVGVDIFFVISGFLISSIIISSLQKGTFSIAEFYARRIKRIFPALILVMTACYVFGWFVLLPDEYKQLGKHIVGGAGFVSNFFFWREAGYFDNAAETKPLLHLWSLGIEEQFYIVWPPLIYLALKRRVNFLFLAITIVAISFSINVGIRLSDRVQDFYSPLTRFWELMMGGILAYLTLQKINPWDKAMQMIRPAFGIAGTETKLTEISSNNAQSVLGMLLIGLAVLLLTKDRLFPGWWALLPTVGSYLVISAGPHTWLNRKVLSHRVLVWFGLISYPLYLWHWPLLSFARIIESGAPSANILVATILSSIVLAWLTYKLIEKPIRFSNQSKSKIIVLCVLMSVIGCIGIITFSRDGISYRINDPGIQKKIRDFTWETTKSNYIKCPSDLQATATPPPKLGYCLLSNDGTPSYALFGDSHADHIFHGIADTDKKNTWLFIGNSSCPPVSGISVVNPLLKNCQEISEKALEHIVNTPSIHTVVLSFFGNYMLDTAFAKDHVLTNRGPHTIEIISGEFLSANKIELFYLGLEKSVKVLEEHGKSVIIVIDVPELPFLPRDCLRSSLFGSSNQCKLSTATVLDRQKELREMLLKLAKAHPLIRVYDPLGLICDKNNCHFETDDLLLYRDSHHLSLSGGAIFAKDFIRWMSQNQNISP